MKKYLKNEFLDEFLKQADDKEKKLSEIAKKRQIKKVLESYGKSPDDIKDIFWRLMASGAGEHVTQTVISNPKILELYLKMKSKGVSDLGIAAKLSELFNNLDYS